MMNKIALTWLAVTAVMIAVNRSEESTLAAIVATVSLTVSLAMYYRPRLIWLPPYRTNRATDLPPLLAVNFLVACWVLFNLDVLMAPEFQTYSNPADLLAERIAWWFKVVIGLFSLVPYAAQLIANSRNPKRLALLWPAAIGAVAVLILYLTAMWFWGMLGKYVVTSQFYLLTAMHYIWVFGIVGLLLPIGVRLWLCATLAGDMQRFDGRGHFAHAVWGMTIGSLAGCLLSVAAVFLGARVGLGDFLGSLLGIVMAVGWIRLLLISRHIAPKGIMRSTISVIVLAIGYWLILIPASFLSASGDFAILIVIPVLPLAAAVLGLAFRYLPKLLINVAGVYGQDAQAV